MKPALKERIFWWIAIPALAGVLALLAVLQYRWSGQVSDAARAQMQSNLHLALSGFRMDFTRELGAACLEVRAAVRESGSKSGEAFNQRFQRWQQSSGHPGLVSDVYLWKSTQRKSTQPQSPQGGPGAADQLVHVFPSTGKPVSVAWPDEFARVKDRLQEMSDIAAQAGGPRWLSGPRPGGPRPSGPRSSGERRNGPRSGQGQKMHDGREVNDGRGSAANQNPDRHSDQPRNQRAGRQGNRSPDNFFPWLVDQSLPLLVSVVRTPNPNSDGASGDGPAPVSLTWVIVRLNPSVLEKEVFPELTQRYFSASGGMDYRVAVTDGGAQEQHVLYSSSAGYRAASNQNSDAETDLFGPFFRRGGGAGPGPRMDMPVPPDTLGTHHPANGSSPAQHGQGKAQGQPQTQAQGQPGDHHDAMESMVRLEPFRFSADDGIWKVQVQHPLGSVDAAVGGLRRRNLMLSFGVLVLLAVTMGMVVIASQRARRLARLQMDFVAGVSHELRTPLAVISSAAENIAHGVVADKQQLARYGATIVKQTRQLTTLVDQVLVFAATQQQPQRYQLRPVDIHEVIAAALENTASIVTAAGASIEKHIDPDLPLASADFSALAQCVQNLITNAVKYGGEDHWVGVRAAAARNDGGNAREIEITVEDHGIGIGEEELKHIFKPFYRSPSVAGSNIHGTGLGLPLAKTVIEAMRGSLTVQSEPGKGSSFTIRLAVAEGLREPREKMSGNVSTKTADEVL